MSILSQENLQDVYTLTALQEGMLFHALNSTRPTAYFEQLTFHLQGILDLQAFTDAWKEVVQRHSVLRTVFAYQKTARPLQMVLKNCGLDIRYFDWRPLDRALIPQHLAGFLADDRRRSFELNKTVPMRWVVIQTADDAFEVVWSHHHLLLDGWSGGIVFTEFLRIYASRMTGSPIPLPPAPPFSEYIRWLQSRDEKETARFWKAYLSGYERAAMLPRLRAAHSATDYRQQVVHFELTEPAAEGLRRLAAEYEVTLNSLMHCLWGIFLSRLNGVSDVAFLAIVSGRPPEIDQIEHMTGLLINTVPVRFLFDSKKPLAVLAKQVHARWLESEPFHHASLAEIQSHAGYSQALMDHLLVFVSYPMEALLRETRNQALGFELVGVDVFEHSNYDFEILIHPETRIHFEFKFNEAVFDQPSVQRLAEAFQALIDSVLANPGCPAGLLNIVSNEDRRRMVDEFNRIEARCPQGLNIHEWFERQVAATPDHCAVVAGTQSLTYRELNQQANHLAYVLRNTCQVQPDDFVGVLLERDERMLVAILGILKAGGAYVPLDPHYPPDRIQYLIRESGCKVLVAEKNVVAEARWNSVEHYLDLASLGGYPNGNPSAIAKLSNAAYLIFTSGSTGAPKGCVVTHGNVVQLFKNDRFQFQFSDRDVWMLAHSFCFDFSVWEMFGALLFGGQVVIARRNQVQNISTFAALLRQFRVSVLSQTPGAFYQLIKEESLRSEHDLSQHLRYVVFGGDRLEPAYLADWITWYPLDRVQLVNMYGITETTVHVTYHAITQKDITGQTGGSPIGKPLPLTQVFVCDSDRNLLPIGVPGEMYVGGDGVSRGYLHRPELTEERFIPNPFRPGEKLYKTGDLARWLPDGTLEFLGRNDDQVQIRGFRVEPGEIERRLLSHEAVKEAVVLARPAEEDSLELAAYLVLAPETAASVTALDLREYLKQFLPDYMVPGQFLSLPALPLTANGKIHKEALLKVREGCLELGTGFIAPRNQLESQLSLIWQELLPLNPISIRDSFFDLGGHSLKATQLVSRIRKRLSVELTLREFLEGATIEQLAKRIQDKRASTFEAIQPAPLRDYYELSNAQRRLWILDRMKGDSRAYHLFTSYRLRGAVNTEALGRAFDSLAARHEALRTTFIEVDGQPQQKIHPPRVNLMERVDLRRRATAETDETQLCLEIASRPFDLITGPLYRVSLLQTADREHILVLCFHHIVIDGWSLSLLVKELAQIYRDDSAPVPPPRIQYKDYSVWQRHLLESGKLDNERDYWHQKMAGELPALALPTDYPRPPEKTYVGRNLRFELDSATLAQWVRCGQESEASLFMVLVAGIKILLHRYSGQEDIIIGAPIAGRPHADLENQVGYYLNTLALRTSIKPTDSFRLVLEKVKATTTEAYEHQLYPFDVLVDELHLQRDTSRAAMFDVLVGLQNQESIRLELEGLEATEIPLKTETSKYDLTFSFTETGGHLLMEIEYNSDLFLEERIHRLSEHFRRILDFGSTTPDRPLFEFNLPSPNELARILHQFNPPATEYPEQKGLAALFEEQVKWNPNAIAVVTEGGRLTYAALNNRANQLASVLRNRFDIQPEELVGMFLDRGEWMLVGILGILKAGAAYAPIDTAFPAERIRFLLEDCRCRVVLTDQCRMLPVSGLGVAVVLPTSIEGISPLPPVMARHGHQLAYAMYTSGSSGQPKGVLVEQRSVARLVKNTNYTAIKPSDHILQLSNYAFDGSVFDIFGALLNGASLYLVPSKSILNPHLLAGFIREHGINITFITTAMFNTLVDIDPDVIGCFDKIYFGGQDASLKHVRVALRHARHTGSIVHVYGPTEATTFSTFLPIDKPPTHNGNLPIGAPIANTRVYILDAFKHPQPVGVPGEIFVAGPGIARGYLNHPELTRERFREDPYRSGERMYQTGDWGRWTGAGQIEFLGRKDNQVKVRGYRIELTEIENTLLRHEAIQQTIVVAHPRKEDGTKELTAYVVLNPGVTPSWSTASLRAFLAESLPDYMIPAHFVALDALPLTPNGKIDQHALPSPDVAGLKSEAAWAGPATTTEALLLNIWKDILGRDNMGIHDNYFAAGGDSIKAIQMSARLHEAGMKLDVTKIFQYQTIAELAQQVARIQPLSEQQPVTGPVPLTAIQSWFFDQYGEGRHHFNQAVLLRTQDRLDAACLERVFKRLQDHHDALRTSFVERDGRIVAENRGLDYPLGFSAHDLRQNEQPMKAIISWANRIQSSLSLGHGPLMKSALFHLKDGDRLLIAIHHLVVDGVSWRVLIEDIRRLTQQAIAGEELTLPPKTDSFKIWAETVMTLSQSPAILDEIPYWESLLSKADQVPCSEYGLAVSDAGTIKESAAVEWHLSPQETSGLLAQCAGADRMEIQDLFLTALARTFHQWADSARLILALESHGRESGLFGGKEVSRTVGWFTAMYPIVLEISGHTDLAAQLTSIRCCLRQIPNKGAGYGVLRYLSQGKHRDSAIFKFQPRISFNYLGQFDTEERAGFFELSDEPMGDPINPDLPRVHILDFVGVILQGRLKFSIYYPTRYYQHSSMEQLGELFREHILSILELCIKSPELLAVAAEIDYDGLTAEQLEAIAQELPDQPRIEADGHSQRR